MGCRRYFTADRFEVLLDEDDSRSSSRVREHRSFLLVSRLHVVSLFLALCEQTDGLFTFQKSPRAYIGAFAVKQDTVD